MVDNPSQNEEKSDSPSKKFTPEILLPLGNLRLKSNLSNNNRDSPGIKKQESEDDEDVERSYSPSKYFGKRPSFEFKNLKSIERPLLNRQFSEFRFKEPRGLNMEKKTSKEPENYKVRFIGEEVIELPESMLGSQTLEKKKAAKSILKKAHFTGEEVPIEKIFDKAYNQGLIEEVMAESSKTLRPVNELLAKNFTKTWHEVEKNEEDALRFLKGVYCENLYLVFKESIELKIVTGIIEKLKRNFDKNEKMVAAYLENFPKIVKFDVVISCLILTEKEDIRKLVLRLEEEKVIDAKKRENLFKVYFLK